MAKRHHSSHKKQSFRSRMHEHEGMEHAMHKKGMPGYSPVFHAKDEHNDEHMHDRMPERFGSYKYDRQSEYRMGKSISEGSYAGAEPRRRQEMADAGMIHEDHNAIANLPQEWRISAYPKTGPYMPEGLDDTLRGVDQQMDYDDSQRARHFYPKKV